MAFITLLTAACCLGVAQASEEVTGLVSLPVARQYVSPSDGVRQRDTVPWDLGNVYVRYGQFTVNVSMGNPPQDLVLKVDSASAETWAFGPKACGSSTSCTGGEFKPTDSKSYVNISSYPEFKIGYLDGAQIRGQYFADDFKVGNMVLKNITMAVAKTASGISRGIIGIGFPADAGPHGKSWEYPTIMDELVLQGKIQRRSYSLYMDGVDATSGSLLFGGYDKSKFEGELSTLPIVRKFTDPVVQWDSLSVTNKSGTFNATSAKEFPAYANLDLGASFLHIPQAAFKVLVESIGAKYQEGSDKYEVDCDLGKKHPGSLNFVFGGPNGTKPVNISVPFSELAVSYADAATGKTSTRNGKPYCRLGVGVCENTKKGKCGFGDTFLRSVYVVYDLDHYEIRMAPIKHKAIESSLVSFGNSTETPVSSSATPNPTATGSGSPSAVGGGGGAATSSPAGGSGGATLSPVGSGLIFMLALLVSGLSNLS
ncbi:aspartic peptidase domain-containing protein [Apiospora arundinis]|uniref:Aspartic peptidase domain-containing protein n=1 Tax=Apiospora arundinis TaxID=335852 RepID=A0ABR2IFD5_9PEZI